MAVRGQLPDSLLQPNCCADSRRSGTRERLSISFTDCKALWICFFLPRHLSARRLGRFKDGVAGGSPCLCPPSLFCGSMDALHPWRDD